MAKYSTELKIKVVKAYLNGGGGYGALAKKYEISNPEILRRWVEVYKSQGYEGLKRSRKNNKYTLEFKQNIVQLYLTGEMSYQDLANQFKINNKSLITRWVIDFREKGLDGLKPKKKGRPSSMTRDKKPKKLPKQEYTQEEQSEIERLKDENYWLKMELDFIKKKIELREKREQEMRKFLE